MYLMSTSLTMDRGVQKGAIWTDSVGLIFASDSVERGEMLTYRPRRHVIITEKVVRLAVVSQKESASSTNFRLVLRIQQTDSCCFGCSAQTLTASNQRYELSALFHDQRATDLLLIYRIERIQQVVQAHLANLSFSSRRVEQRLVFTVSFRAPILRRPRWD